MHKMQREVLAMKIYYVTFRSVTHGQRAERLLRQEGFQVVLVRTPKWMEARGCGYSLRIRTNDVEEVKRLLMQNNIPMQKVYIQRGEGDLEELQ
jgi:hypothetical protein